MVDTYIDHPVQLRDTARPGAAGVRSYTFEIAVVLCVALIAATAWAVLAAGWVNGGGGAIVVAVTSVIEAALLAQARAPRIAAAIAAPFLGLAAIVPTTLAAMPAVPGQTAGGIAGQYLQALVTGLASTHDWDFTVGLCAVLFLCGYWLGWTVLREHRGVLAVIPVFSVLATNVVNARDPNPIALPETVAVVLALAVVAAAHLGSLGARWASSRITALEGLGWRFGTSAAGVAVVLTIVALVLPPVSTADLSTRLFPNGLGIGSGGVKGGGQQGLAGAATIGFNPAVELGGRLVSRPRTVFTYTDDASASVDFAVVNDTQFDKGNWFPPARGAPAAAGVTWNGVPIKGGPLPVDTNPADGALGSQETPVHADIVLDPAATGDQALAPFAGEPSAIDAPGTAFGTVIGPSQSTLLTVDSVELQQNVDIATDIVTTGLISTATEAQLRAAGTGYPKWTAQLTGLNDDGTHGAATIHSLAVQWTAGKTNPYDQAIAIQQHLRDPAFFQYTLNPPQVPNATQWTVVYFLTTSHKGYCQYFASAMGSMLRSLGIPTRLVSGFGPGATADINGPQAIHGHNEQIVTSSDAHSWVEAYFPGYGWIPFEPTPPSAQGNYQPFARGAAAVQRPSAPPATAVPGQTQKPGNAPGSDPQLGRTARAHGSVPAAVMISLIVLGAIVVLIVVAVLWLLLPRSLAGAWKRVETLGVISGVDRRKAETHSAFAARLARARPRAGSALNELARVTARSEFSASGASPPERAQALRTWRKALFAATLRPRKSPG